MMEDAALEREILSYGSTAPVKTSGGNRVERSKLLSLLDNCRAVYSSVMVSNPITWLRVMHLRHPSL